MVQVGPARQLYINEEVSPDMDILKGSHDLMT